MPLDRVWTPAEVEEQSIFEAEASLHFFVQLMWKTVEPKRKFVDGWLLRAMCEHLEGVADGRMKRLIINVPPGSMKSLLTNCFFPAWLWGPKNQPHLRFFTASYSSSLTERDNERMRMLITSPEYRMRWGKRFTPGDSKIKLANDKSGWKIASSVEGTTTGERGDFCLIDDPNDIQKTESPIARDRVRRWLNEVMPTRLTDPANSAIILIQQRTHQEDATATMLEGARGGDDWDYFMVPMEYDPEWSCGETSIGWTDPRSYPGELCWPERFSQEVVEGYRVRLGPYAFAGQMQQHPEPRGGAIIKRDWWQLYGKPDEDPTETRMRFPAFSFVLGSLDCALTDKDENDPSALVMLGIWTVPQTGRQAVMVINCWVDRLQINPLVKRVAATCDRYRADVLIIENKANGHSVEQEIRRLYSRAEWSVQFTDPTRMGEKTARAHSVTHLFEEGLIWHPNTGWADDLISECAIFPRGSHDDRVDALVQALRYLREHGLLQRRQEARWNEQDMAAIAREKAVPRPLYPA